MADEFKEFVSPGARVWFRIEKDGEEVAYGLDGDLVYQGYQMIGTTTFLVLDKIDGEGKKAQTKSLMKNTNRIIDMGIMS